MTGVEEAGTCARPDCRTHVTEQRCSGRRDCEGCVPTRADRAFCLNCEHRVGQALAELPGLYGDLLTELAEPTSTWGQRVSGSPEPPVPLRMSAWNLAGEIEGWLRDQQQALRAVHGWRALELKRLWTPAEQVERRAGWLRRRLSVLLAAEFGADAGLEMFELHDRCRAVLGLNEPPSRVPAPCSKCGRRALVRRNGQDMVRCEPAAGGCGEQWSFDHLPWLAKVAVASLPKLRESG